MNLNQLQTFLNENDIPRIKIKPKTFLGIAKQPHYENVLSNMYAFYFDVNEEHKLKDLFISSLLECISKSKLSKAKEALQTFYAFDIDTEFTTRRNGRIDLLLHNNDQAIIIENKVYHRIKDNNLDDYWASIRIKNDCENKIGVILSLHPIPESLYNGYENSKHYINITHLDLLQTVMRKCGVYLLEANSKYVTFLKDLYQNIINLSQPLMEENDFNFYFEHHQKINQLISLKKTAREYVEHEVKEAYYEIEGLKLELNESKGELGSKLTYYVSEKHKNLMFTIVYYHLLSSEGQLKIVIELQNDALQNKELYKQMKFSVKENELVFEKFYNSNKTRYEHFAIKIYDLEKSEIKNLRCFIIDKLNNDGFIDVFKELESILEARKSQII